MLRSYEYTDQPYSHVSFQSQFYRQEEERIARTFVYGNPPEKEQNNRCPVCGEKEGKFFYSKWGADYLRCEACKSVFTICSPNLIKSYRENSELLSLRRSEAYQREVTARREESWLDFLEWMEVRAFRFLHRNKELSIIDFGNRFEGYVSCIQESKLCGDYNLRESILKKDDETGIERADIVFYLDQMQQIIRPGEKLESIGRCLKADGLLVLGTRAGSGFDILTLKDQNSRIYPYEHVTLPSINGLITALNRSGYQILEVTTPGVMDVQYVRESVNELRDSEFFVKHLLDSASESALQEFQRFLQKNCLSSFVRIIAKKRKDKMY